MSELKLSNLDRCIHGRHSIDACLDCPGGWSTGNGFLKNGQRIGTDHAGNPIHIATRRSLRDGSDHPLDRGIGSFPLESNEKG